MRGRCRLYRRRVLVGLIAGLLMLTACTGGSAPGAKKATTTTPAPATTTGVLSPPTLTVNQIQFTDCTDRLTSGLPRSDADRISRLTIGCGRVDVPLNYAEPYSKQLQLYVVKVHDNSQSNHDGSLVVNPGGPGASGVQLAVNLSLKVSLAVLDHYDIIGFDPRGVFLSGALECVTNAQKDRIAAADPDVRTAAGLAAATALYAPIGPACAKSAGADLRYYNTENTARDLDLIRQAVGDNRFNYLGYSYGSTLGALYAQLFPGYSRRMVLDGAVDPHAGQFAATQTQLAGFELAFNRFAANCATLASCRVIGSARPAVSALATRADRSPIPTTRTGDTRRATGAIVLNAVKAALYDSAQWPTLATAIRSAQGGDSRGLFALVDGLFQRSDDGTYSNLIDANIAVTCNDAATTPTAAQVQSLARTWSTAYPLFGGLAASGLLACRGWPAPRTPVPAIAANPATTPVLVIGTTYDPVTPPAGAAALSRAIGAGITVTWQGEGHTAYPKTSCITSIVDAYLDAGRLPAAGQSCPAQ